MKSLFFLIFMIHFYDSFSQKKDKLDSTCLFSKYEFYDSENESDKIRNILKEDNKTLIINLNNSEYITLKNKKINCYTICRDTIINKIKVKKYNFIKCKRLLDTLISINPEKIKNEIDKKGNKITVWDGSEYDVRIYLRDKKMKLYSYSPETYSEDRFPDNEKRKLFLNCFQELKKYFYDNEFNRIKSLDTLYLYVERNKNQKYFVDINKQKNKRQENYFINFKCATAQFINLNIDNSNQTANVIYKKKEFLKKNATKIINYEYLKKFTQCDMNQLIDSNTKKIFIIDKDEIYGNLIKIKEVKGGTYCF